MGMRRASLVVVILVFLSFHMARSVIAQETNGTVANNVCLVYFTSSECGDECTITDSFMGGIMAEYSDILTAIIYRVPGNGENDEVFHAYAETYSFRSETPVVLFGEGDYLWGKEDIFKGTEESIVSLVWSNGSNCPLESGYVPPEDIGSPGAVLPGAPEIVSPLEPLDGDPLEDEEAEGKDPGDQQTDKGRKIPQGLRAEEDAVYVSGHMLLLLAGLALLVLVLVAVLRLRK